MKVVSTQCKIRIALCWHCCVQGNLYCVTYRALEQTKNFYTNDLLSLINVYFNYVKNSINQITYDIFDKIDIRVGTVISVKKNEKARKPSLVDKVDFGQEIGIKQSSAQITHYYNEENLKGKQVIGVCNFAEKNIAGIVSQVLILGSIDKEGKVILLHPSQKSENGLPVA